MFADNHYYGHSAVLRDYIGDEALRPFSARVQHGWQPGLGFETHRRDDPWPLLIWNHRNLALCRQAGFRNPTPIGAPFLYLPPLEESVSPKDSMSLLAFPFHGWEREPLTEGLSRYADGLLDLQKQGFGPVTVCLYWHEYDNANTRREFEERGFAVTSLGHRDGHPEFLQKQRNLIMSHQYVTSNRISTAPFYAMSSGRMFFLHGPFMDVSTTPPSKGNPFEVWQQKHFGHLSLANFRDQPQRELGAEELGLEFKRSPEELRSILHVGRGSGRRRTWFRYHRSWVGAVSAMTGRRARISAQVNAALDQVET